MSDDTVSRKSVLDALDALCDRECEYSKQQRNFMCGACRLGSAFDVIDELPSAQPEHLVKESGNLVKGLVNDCISRQDAIDALEREKTYSAAYKYGYTQTDYFKQYNMGLTDGIKALNKLPSALPERTCVNCGRTVNNGGWYADGGTRCPIEEHYALPKDGYCHLWEKRNVADDDYPERRTDE
jgi:hypothetical protein